MSKNIHIHGINDHWFVRFPDPDPVAHFYDRQAAISFARPIAKSRDIDVVVWGLTGIEDIWRYSDSAKARNMIPVAQEKRLTADEVFSHFPDERWMEAYREQMDEEAMALLGKIGPAREENVQVAEIAELRREYGPHYGERVFATLLIPSDDPIARPCVVNFQRVTDPETIDLLTNNRRFEVILRPIPRTTMPNQQRESR